MQSLFSNPFFKAFGVLLFLLLVLGFMNNSTSFLYKTFARKSSSESYTKVIDQNVKIALVSCGSDHINAFTLIKSTIIFTSKIIEFHIITEKANEIEFVKQFATWPDAERLKFTYQFTEPFFPSDGIDWRPLFRICSTQRLFVADMFNSTDAILYMDTDVLLLDDVVQLWEEFKNFDEKQLIAFAPDFYNKHNYSNGLGPRIPFYGKQGLNAGVIVMNLTRIREFKMYEKLVQVYHKYKDVIVYGDQCLLNALFSEYPDRVYDLDCSWNFFFPYCYDQIFCPSANNTGMKLLHGAGGTFKSAWPGPKFRLTYDAFRKYDFIKTKDNIYLEIQQVFKNTPDSICMNQTGAFLKPLAKLATQFNR